MDSRLFGVQRGLVALTVSGFATVTSPGTGNSGTRSHGNIEPVGYLPGTPGSTPVSNLPSPVSDRSTDLQSSGALPVELKDLAHRRFEVVETRTLAALGDQLGVGTDRQAERTLLCF